MRNIILTIIADKKTITRESLRKLITSQHPENARWELSYAITSLHENGYIHIQKSTPRKWNSADTFSITKLGKAQIKLLEIKRSA